MRDGRYFRIPEGPADLERLWYAAEPIPPGDSPTGVPRGQGDNYRLAGSASWPSASGSGREQYLAEVRSLREVGLVVDSHPLDPLACRFYVPAPGKEVVWSIGILSGESPFRLACPEGLSNPVVTREDVTDIPAAFVADPFMLREGGTWFMFFEVMNGLTGLGEIGLATSRDGLEWTYEQIVLAEQFHLSYPLVFRWGHEHYMIPESYQAGAVRLYQAAAFPRRWSLVGELFKGPYLVDATVFRHEDRWWMFADTSPGCRHDTLRLFHADDLLGPWQEHPRSPLIEGNPLTARPAGRIQTVGSRPIRLAQACQPHYGTAVRAFEITKLNARHYEEREVGNGPVLAASGAGWNACGMHHMDAHFQDDGPWLACGDGWFCGDSVRSQGAARLSTSSAAWNR